MIAAIIFDCFGVLTEDGWLAFVNKYGTPEIAEELRYLNHMADRGDLDYRSFLTQVCGLTAVPEKVAHEMITTTHHPNEAIFELIRKLKRNGYQLGVISNVGSPLTDFLAQEYVDLFDHITLSYQVAAIKPEPRIYEAYLESVNLSPEQVVFIDDREPNSQGARAVGMHAITYQNSDQLLKELRALDINIEHKK